MTDNLAQPRFDDAVQGGQSPPPINDVVLGGLEGVKQRLASKSDKVKIAALKDALKYGQPGLDLLFEMMLTGTGSVQREAYYLLYPEQTPTQLTAEELTDATQEAVQRALDARTSGESAEDYACLLVREIYDESAEDYHLTPPLAGAIPIPLQAAPLAGTTPVQEPSKPKSWIKRLFGWGDSETG